MVRAVSAHSGSNVLALVPVAPTRPSAAEAVERVVARPGVEGRDRPGGVVLRRQEGRVAQEEPKDLDGREEPRVTLDARGLFVAEPIPADSPQTFQQALAGRAPAVFGGVTDDATTDAALRSIQILSAGLDRDAVRGNFLDLFA